MTAGVGQQLVDGPARCRPLVNETAGNLPGHDTSKQLTKQEASVRLGAPKYLVSYHGYDARIISH